MQKITYSPFNAIKGIHILAGFLAFIISLITLSLIFETGEFFNQAFHSGISLRGYIYAAMIEIIAIILVEILAFMGKPINPIQWIFRFFAICLLIGIFLLVVGGASMRAVMPIINQSKYSAEDMLKLKSMEEAVAAQREAVAAVKGQKNNSAWRASELSEMIKEKNEFLANLEPDTALILTSRNSILLNCFLRIVLQAGNWILCMILGSLIKKYFFTEQAPKSISLEQIKDEQDYEAETVFGAMEILSQGQELPETPQSKVRKIFPHAKCKQESDKYIVKAGGAMLGQANNSPFAWVDALKNISNGNGNGNGANRNAGIQD